MRSRTTEPGRGAARAAAPLALLLATACGTWSNEDVRFYEALPTRPELKVEVPVAAVTARLAGGPEAAVAACGIGSAEPWMQAKATSDGINASVDWILGLVDVVRRAPPTTRLHDGRIWGPFDDDQHPGNEIRITILRTFREDLGGVPQHDYAFEARRKAGGAFAAILSGAFVGPSAKAGTGAVLLDFDAIRALGMADPDSPFGTMRVEYDRAVEPRTIVLALQQADAAGFGLERFEYRFEGYQDGRGRFDYAFRQPAAGGSDLLQVYAGFDPAGAGRGEVRFTAASGASGGYRQCWDAAACLTWVLDPTGYLCGGVTPCTAGAESACPAGAPSPVPPP